MLDRILDQRGQHHRRQLGFPELFGHGNAQFEPLAHSSLLHAEVGERQCQFTRERRATTAHLWQCRAQITREVVQHCPALAGIGLVEALDMGQGVEQEMGLDLCVQHPHLRLGHLSFQRNACELRRVQRGPHGRLAGHEMEDARQQPTEQQGAEEETDKQE